MATGTAGGTFHLARTSSDACGLPENPAFTLIDERGEEILSFPSPATRWAPVPVGAGTGATIVSLVWSNHLADAAYRCARRTAVTALLRIELPSWFVGLEFPPSQRVTFCAEPPEAVFVGITAR